MSNIKLFEGTQFRTRWDNDEDCWYFVIQDVVAFLTESTEPSKYWHDMKRRTLENEGVELSAICRKLKFTAPNGKPYKYECANNEALFRIIQSIPSPKAEPFKRWLAKLGKERIEEIEKPEKAIERGKAYYKYKGRDEDWIDKRVNSIATRNDLTDYWKSSGVKGKEYGILTNQIYTSTFGYNSMEYRQKKGLKKDDSLRNNMNTIEIVVTLFSEQAAKEIAEAKKAQGFVGNSEAIKESGKIVSKAVKELEEQIGKPIVSTENFKHLDTDGATKKIIQSENPNITKQIEESKKKKIEMTPFNKTLKALLSVPKDEK